MIKDLPPFSKLALSVLLIVVTGMMVFLFTALLAIPVFDVNYFTNPGVLISNLALAKFMQIGTSIGIFLVPSFLIAYIFQNSMMAFLKMDRLPSLLMTILGILSIIFALPLIQQLALWNMNMELPEALSGLENWMKATEEAANLMIVEFMRMDTPMDLVVNFTMIALIPAIGEELLFRGVIQKYMQEWTKNVHIAIWVTAFLFSALHMQFYGFLPRFLLGVYLGYLMIWSGSIWLPILVHLINNGSAVIYYYFNQAELNEEMMNGTEIPQDNYLLIISLIVFIGLTFLMVREKRKLGRSLV